MKSMLTRSTLSRYADMILVILLLLIGFKLFMSISCIFSTDGPSHIYNSIILKNINTSNIYSEYFQKNSQITPNYFIYGFTMVLSNLMDYETIESILVWVLIISPIVILKMISALFDNRFKSFLFTLIPLAYSFFHGMGMYNFLFGVFFLLLFFYIDLKYSENKIYFILLFILSFLIYFSHLFSYLIFTCFVLIKPIYNYLIKSNRQHSSEMKYLFLKEFLIVLILLPTIYFCYEYFSSSMAFKKENVRLSFYQLFLELFDLRFNTLFYQEERICNNLIGVILFSTVLFIIQYRFIGHSRKVPLSLRFYHSDIYFFIFICLLIGYFILPDSDGSFGYVSSRLLYTSFLFLILWILINERFIPKWYRIISSLIFVFIFFVGIREFKKDAFSNLCKIKHDVINASKYIPNNSVVLPIHFSDNSISWIIQHFSNYLSFSGKNLVILENYECSLSYFPLRWNISRIPKLKLGNESLEKLRCLWYVPSSGDTTREKNIDYVLLYNKEIMPNDSCYLSIQRELQNKYSVIYRNESIILYKLN